MESRIYNRPGRNLEGASAPAFARTRRIIRQSWCRNKKKNSRDRYSPSAALPLQPNLVNIDMLCYHCAATKRAVTRLQYQLPGHLWSVPQLQWVFASCNQRQLHKCGLCLSFDSIRGLIQQLPGARCSSLAGRLLSLGGSPMHSAGIM